MRIALRAREVTVPDFTNKTTNDATAEAATLGLTLRVDDIRRPDPKIAPGASSRRSRRPAPSRGGQRSIKVWLSAGQRASTVPQLTGETERTAQLRLAQDGLTLAAVSEIRSNDLPVRRRGRAGSAGENRRRGA